MCSVSLRTGLFHVKYLHIILISSALGPDMGYFFLVAAVAEVRCYLNKRIGLWYWDVDYFSYGDFLGCVLPFALNNPSCTKSKMGETQKYLKECSVTLISVTRSPS